MSDKSPFDGEGLFEYPVQLTRAQYQTPFSLPGKASLHRPAIDPTPADLQLALSHVLDRDGWTRETLLSVPGVYAAVSAYLREEVLEYLSDDLTDPPTDREEN